MSFFLRRVRIPKRRCRQRRQEKKKQRDKGKKKKYRKKKKEEKEEKNGAAKRKLCVYPVHVTEKERESHVNLLLHSRGGMSHYSAIIDLSALKNSQ